MEVVNGALAIAQPVAHAWRMMHPQSAPTPMTLAHAYSLCRHWSRQWLALSLLVALGLPASAATLTWSNGGDGLWSNTANWGGATLANGDALVFGTTTGTTTLNNDITAATAGLYVGAITFSASAPSYTLGGNNIIGVPGGVTTNGTSTSFAVNSASGITQTINNNFTLFQNAVNITGSGDLTLGGSITKGGTWNPFLQMNGTGVLTLNGATTMNNAGGTAAYQFNSGTVVLAKSVAGAFNVSATINGSTVRLDAADQLKAVPSLTINSGILDLNGYNSQTALPTANALSLNGLGGLITNGSAGTTSTLVIGGASTTSSYGGTISDGAGKVALYFNDAGAGANLSILSGQNNYSGGTNIRATTGDFRPAVLSIADVASIGSVGYRNLTFSGNSATDAQTVLQLTGTSVTNSNQFDGLTFTSGNAVGIDVADPANTFTLGKNAAGTDITMGGTGLFMKKGAGTLEIASTLTYTGSTLITGGTVKIDAQAGGALASTSPLNMAGGDLYLLGKTTGTTTQTLGSVSMGYADNNFSGVGGSKITVDANGGGGTTLALGTMVNSTVNGGTLNIKVGTGGTVTTTTTSVTNGLLGNGRVVFTDASDVVDFAGISASGTPRTVQAATYTSGLPTSGSTSTVNYSQTGDATVTASESVNALKLTTSTTGQSLAIDPGQTLTLTTGGLLFTGANDYSITGGTLKSNTATNSDLMIHQYGTGNLTIGSVIADGVGKSVLTKAGDGTLILSGTNTYTGLTLVTGGTLSISSDSNLGGTNGTFANLTSSTGSSSVTYTGSLPTGFVVGSTILGRTVTAINTGTSTITLSGNANANLTTGTASWAYTSVAASQYDTSGLWLSSGGVLQATSSFSLSETNGTTTATRRVTIGNGGGGFDVTGANTLTVPGTINATGMMSKSGTGTLVLSGANSITAGVTIEDGTVRLGNANALGATATSNLIFGSESGTAPKLQLNNYDAKVTSLVSSNTNAVVENGAAGTKTLTVYNGADNTFAGILQNGSAGVLALAKTGGGTLTLTNTNTYTGTTTVSNGELQVGSAGTGTTGTGAVTVQSGATILGTGTVKGITFTAQSGSLVQAGDGTAQTNYGTLNFTPASGSGTFDFQAGSTTTLGINPSGTSDSLNFNGLSAGTLKLNGNLTITAPAGYTPTGPATFDLLDWTNISTKTFDPRFSASSYTANINNYLFGNGDDNLGFDLPDISGSGYAWDISSFTTDGTISIVLAPEPSRMMLMAVGVIAVCARRRRAA